MDCVHGRVFSDPELTDAAPAERTAMYDSMNPVLARLHTRDPAAIGLGDFGRPGHYFSRRSTAGAAVPPPPRPRASTRWST